MLLGYEILYHRARNWRWFFIDAAPVWMAAIVMALSIRRKIGGGGQFSGNPYYALHLTLDQYIVTSRKFLYDLFWLPEDTFPAIVLIGVLLLIIAIAAVSRRRYMWLCALLMIVGPLPVNFILPRGLFAIYTVMIGWTIFIASALVLGRDWLYTRVWKRPPLRPDTWEPERVFLLLALVIAMLTVHKYDQQLDWTVADWSNSRIYQLKTSIQRLNPKLSSSSSILFLDDKFTRDEWIPMLLIRMMYRNPDLTVDRVKMMDHRPNGVELAAYTYVFDYRGGRLIQVNSPAAGSSLRPASIDEPCRSDHRQRSDRQLGFEQPDIADFRGRHYRTHQCNYADGPA
jgi:hypothetical protein